MIRFIVLLTSILALSGCTELEFASHVAKNAAGPSAMTRQSPQGNFKVGKPYNVAGQTYYPKESYDHVETGIASWYGPGFQGKRTASGERFDTAELTAAHRTLQMPSLVRVTNLENGRSVVVRVNDRGPFARGRVIDVSQRAAELLGFRGRGTAKVRLEVLPEESLRVAEMARRGESTSGFEMAANQQGEVVPVGNISVASVTSEVLPPMAVHEAADGRIMPDAVVTQVPVNPGSSNIYIQAGSFSVADNAQRLSASLGQVGRTSVIPAIVRGQQFYRVRVGPIQTVGAADRLLGQVVAMGNSSAIIVVE
jgi:rare lipoprotein A